MLRRVWGRADIHTPGQVALQLAPSTLLCLAASQPAQFSTINTASIGNHPPDPARCFHFSVKDLPASTQPRNRPGESEGGSPGSAGHARLFPSCTRRRAAMAPVPHPLHLVLGHQGTPGTVTPRTLGTREAAASRGPREHPCPGKGTQI